jgi:hypothetical protein
MTGTARRHSLNKVVEGHWKLDGPESAGARVSWGHWSLKTRRKVARREGTTPVK